MTEDPTPNSVLRTLPRRIRPDWAVFTTLAMTLVACNSAPSTSPSQKAGPPASLPYSTATSGLWKSVSTLSTDAPKLVSGYLSDQLRNYLSDQPTAVTEITNGWGLAEPDRSNGDKPSVDGQQVLDGEPLSLSGVKFAKGLGVHALSELVFSMDGTCTQFSASVGIDDSVRAGGKYNAQGKSSVSFKVLTNQSTDALFDSGVMTERSATQKVNVKLPLGATTLRLLVSDGGDGISYDHADWADARVTCGGDAPTPETPVFTGPGLNNGYLSDPSNFKLATVVAKGWGPVELDQSNGDLEAGDGQPLSLSGVKFARGLGVHAISDISFPLNGSCTRFKASVGIDDSVRAGGKYNAQGKSSVSFEVYAGADKLFGSGVMTEKSSTQNIDVDLPANAKTLRLVVGDGGDDNRYDHADWAGARVECGAAAPLPPAELPSQPQPDLPSQPQPVPTNVAYKGVSAAMWAEVDAQAAKFGDPHNCHARVDAIPKSGLMINPGNGNIINDALGKSDTVILKGGTYTIAQTLNLDGKTLIGAAGEEVVINASGVLAAVRLGNSSVLANVKIVDARNVGIELLENSTLYRVSVARTGRSGGASGYLSTNGRAYHRVSDNSGNNCLVSTEARDSYNDRRYDGTLDGVTAEGGNGDGYVLSANTIIDSYSYNNSDDGFDFWESRMPNYVYFSEAFGMGKSTLGFPNPAGKSGDGNGFKLGRGDQVNYIYKSKAYNNKANGFDLNTNTRLPVIIDSESYDNGGSDWAGGLTGNTQ